MSILFYFFQILLCLLAYNYDKHITSWVFRIKYTYFRYLNPMFELDTKSIVFLFLMIGN